MKARLFVVSESTIKQTILSETISVITPQPTGKQWLKTIADIMADMLQIEIGDYIFLWETRSSTQKNRIHGVYRAISKPYYELSSKNDNAPFKIRIEKAFDFEKPVDEYDLLNCPYIKTTLWTIIGKKVAGKSRGSTPLSPDETKALISLLIDRNPNYIFTPFQQSHIIDIKKPLNIDYSIIGDSPAVTALKDFHPNDLPFFKNDYSVKYEKTMETIFNQEMSLRNRTFYNQIGVNTEKVIWYSNYLPYSIEQSEMDYLIMESDDGINICRIFLLEFMINTIDESHIYRSMMYSKWVNETLAYGARIVHPIVICSKSFDFINGETDTRYRAKYEEMGNYIKQCEVEFSTKPLKIFTYDFSTGTPVFTRLR